MGLTENAQNGARPQAGPLYVASLAKGLRILRAFDETATEMSLGELSRKSGLDRSAVQRLANTLHVEGFLEKDPVSRRFSPSLAWLELAYAYYWSDALVAVAMPKLIDLSRDIGETVNLARLRGSDLVYVSRLPSKRSSFGAITVGRCLPALGTAAGQAILATWSSDNRCLAVADWPLRRFTKHTIMDRQEIGAGILASCTLGYAITQEQVVLGEISVAAPICGAGGMAMAAVQCSVSNHSWTPDRVLTEIIPILIDTTNSISSGMPRVYS